MRNLLFLVALGGLVAAPGCRRGVSQPGPAGSEGGAAPDVALEAGVEAVDESGGEGPALSFARIAVIGASVSAGFGSLQDVAAMLDAAAREPHEVGDYANVALFREPFVGGERQVDSAVELRPTVVFAIDFLFWYAYGYGWTAAEREENVERGLRQLERFDVPVLVGDVPDMTGAAEWMLSPDQIPAPEVLAALNERIRVWAAERVDVVLLPLSEWTAPLRAAAPVVLDETGRTVEPRELMSRDGLHPNAAGLRYLLRKVFDRIRVRYPGTAADALGIPPPLEEPGRPAPRR